MKHLYIHIHNDIYNKNIIDMKIHIDVHKAKIIEYIIKNKVVTSSEIAKLLKLSWNTADSYLKDLVIEGKIQRIKKEGVNLWLKK